MILTKKEINDLTPNLGDLWRIKSSHFKAIDRIKELEEEKLKMEYQKDQAETMLQELVEAAEWRDECNALYSEMYQDWLCDDEAPESQDWMESIFDISESSEAAYQAALKAAKSNT